jgi:hypothetical protein
MSIGNIIQAVSGTKGIRRLELLVRIGKYKKFRYECLFLLKLTETDSSYKIIT